MTLSVPEYLQSDATELARLVRAGEVSVTELLEIAEAQLARLNPKLNAVNLTMAAEARARAKQFLVGPLAGVPLLIKDAIQDYAGLPTSNGSRAFRHIIPKQHSTFVQRLIDAGTVIIGKSNTPELALKGVTDPKAFGVTRNPWDLSRTSGGSSGGSAAAVAAGIVPMAGANDGGGSIRIRPLVAACSGCGPRAAAFRPGRVSAKSGRALRAITC
ncbi:Asp-tRNA(Asn)/Glu-tRNA(Gln) amidotransferase A subunit family amidase [Bradyrhizobium sp. USDA 4341]